MRINRFLARAGVASRRKAEELVVTGRVSLNGKVIESLATEVDELKDTVMVEKEVVTLPKHVYYALNKPKSYTCTRFDKYAEKTVFELLPNDNSLITVGRLDVDTTGLLLITNDGNFVQNIIHPTNKIKKTYLAKLKKPSNSLQIKELTSGVSLEDGSAQAVDAKIIDNNTIQLAIEEGRKRIVRRMIKAVGNDVVELKRTQIGNIVLDTKEGEFRELTNEEIKPYV